MDRGYNNDSRGREIERGDRGLNKEKPRYVQIKKEIQTTKKEPEKFKINLDLIKNKDSISLGQETNFNEEDSTSEKVSRWVSVDTISTAPIGCSAIKSLSIKDQIIKFRCSTYEKKLLIVKVKRSGLTLSEYFRRIAFEQQIVERLSDDEIEIYQMLVKYHNNFKAISNLVKKKNPTLNATVLELANEMKLHLKKFHK